MNTRAIRNTVCASVLAFSFAVSSTSGVHADTYTPNPVGSLDAVVESGVARRVTLSWTAPSNINTVNLSGYDIKYRCETKLTRVGACTGKWRPLDFLEVESDDVAPGSPIEATYTLPANSQIGGRDVTFSVSPVNDLDNPIFGQARTDTVRVIDTPTLIAEPLRLTSTAKRRLTIGIKSTAISSANGSTVSSYSVHWSTNGVTWVSIPAPGTWAAGGATKTMSVSNSGRRYYIRLTVATTAGSVVVRQSVISR